jgi:hypothetical protein
MLTTAAVLTVTLAPAAIGCCLYLLSCVARRCRPAVYATITRIDTAPVLRPLWTPPPVPARRTATGHRACRLEL